MSKWLKQFLFGIWGLLLIPLITPILKKWLEENVFSDPNDMATTVFRNAVATPVFENLLALGQQRWFKFVLVFWTGIVIGVSLEWLNRKSDEKKASELRSLGSNFAVFQTALKFGPRPRDGRTMWVISSLQSRQYLTPPGNFTCGSRMSTCTSCRMRHSFVNTSDASVSF
jgi:hypothetical protein